MQESSIHVGEARSASSASSAKRELPVAQNNDNGVARAGITGQPAPNGVNQGSSAKSMQPLVPITTPNAGKDYDKCFVHIQPCYPFGISNEDEQMLVVTPDSDFSLYEDAFDTTPYEKLKPETPSKTNKSSSSSSSSRKNRQKQPPPPPPQHHRGHHDIPLIDRKVIFESLPKISYRDLEEDDPPTFKRPGAYIYYIDKTPEDENNQVQYDMDSEDEVFIAKCNKTRRSEGLRPLTHDHFELVMDRLEKETFRHQTNIGDLTVAQPPPPLKEEDPDDACCVCFDGTSDDTNQIVYCDGCDMAVHQECYGIQLIPELQWFCQKCESDEKKKHIACVLCGGKEGALKRTLDNDWVHIICMQWIPEISAIAELGGTGKDPIGPRGFKHKVPKARYKLTCSICKKKGGACIQCRERVCTTAFHVPCIRKHSFKRGIRQPSDDEDSDPYTFIDWAYCEKHVKSRKKQAKKEKREKESDSSSSGSESEEEEQDKKEEQEEEQEEEEKEEEEEQKEVESKPVVTKEKGKRKPGPGRPRKKVRGKKAAKQNEEEGERDGTDEVEQVEEGETPKKETIVIDSDDEEEHPKKNHKTKAVDDVELEDDKGKGSDAAPADSDDSDDKQSLSAKESTEKSEATKISATLNGKPNGIPTNTEAESTTKAVPADVRATDEGSVKVENDVDMRVGKPSIVAESETVNNGVQAADERLDEEVKDSSQQNSSSDKQLDTLTPSTNNETNNKADRPITNNINENNNNNSSTNFNDSKKKKKKKTDNLEPYLKPAEKEGADEADEIARLEEEELLTKELPSWYTTLSNSGQRDIISRYKLIPIKLAQKLIKAPSQAVVSIFPYWAQKRHSRSGMPLLKRFQPSILANRKEGRQIESEKDAEECLEDMKTIRHDLERVRILLELIKKRERAKRNVVEAVSSWFEQSCDPMTHSLTFVLDCLHREDKKDIFRAPVTNEIAPGYSDVVKNPMDLTTMRQKLEDETYKDAQGFWDDATLMYENAKLFNDPTTHVYRYTEHMIKYTNQLRASYDAGALFSNSTAPEDSEFHKHTYHPPKRRKRLGFQIRRNKRPPKQHTLPLGEFGLKDTGEEGDNEEEGEEESGHDGNEQEPEAKRMRLDDDDTSTEKKKKKKHATPETPSRRSSRNTGEEADVVMLDEKPKKKKHARAEVNQEEIVIEEEPVEMSEEEAKKVEEALALKSDFKMGKNELYAVLERLEREDNQNLFSTPVEKDIPEYTTVIAHPMCFEAMHKKVKWNKYTKWDLFWNDIRLIFTNSMRFNAKKSIFFTEAKRLLAFSRRQENLELVKKAKTHNEYLDYLNEYKRNAKVERQKKASEAAAIKREEKEKVKREVLGAPDTRFTRSGHTSSTLTPTRGRKRKHPSGGAEKEEESEEEDGSEGEEEESEREEEVEKLASPDPPKRPRGRPRKVLRGKAAAAALKKKLEEESSRSEGSEDDEDVVMIDSDKITSRKKPALTVSVPTSSNSNSSTPSSTPTDSRKRVEFSPGPQPTLYFDKTQTVEAVATAAKELKAKLAKEADRKAEVETKKDKKRSEREETPLREPSKRTKKNGIDTDTYATPTHSTSPPKSTSPGRGRKAPGSILTSRLSPPKTPPSTSSSASSSPTSPPISPNSFQVWSLRRKQRLSASSPSSDSSPPNPFTSSNNNNNNNNSNKTTTSTKKLKQGKINSFFTPKSRTDTPSSNATSSNSTQASTGHR